MPSILKRILLITILLIVAGGIGFGLYYFFIKKGPIAPPSAPPSGAGPSGQLPIAGERPAAGQPGAPGATTSELPVAGTIPTPTAPSLYRPVAVSQLTNTYAVFPSLSNNGIMRYHNAADGKFYRVEKDGSIKEMSDQIFFNVSNVTWAKSQDKAVLEYPDNTKVIYDFGSHKQLATLPKHWQGFSFSPEGNQIAAKSIGLAPENRWLVVTNDDGTGTEAIEPLGNNADKVKMDWSPSRQVVAFSETGEPLGFDRAQILLIGLNHENFKGLTVEGRGFTPEWSPTGKKLLYSVYSNRTDLKPELWITTSYGDQIDAARKMLNIYTWADKCSFGDDDTLFCAVPRDLPQGAGLAREIANSLSDDLYKIDLKTGLSTPLSLGNEQYTINSITYDKTKNKLFFTAANKTGIFEAGL